MIYFIPAWYNNTNFWDSTDRAWFQKNEVMDFDDISTQVRVFLKGEEPITILVLNYAPTFRRFLHKQEIMEASYFSVFDELQGFEHDYVHPINYLELKWPDNISFHFNPFMVTVMQAGALYAKVYLSRDGTLVSIRFFNNDLAIYEYFYDDRGFLSSILMFDEEGNEEQQNYLNRKGQWIIGNLRKTGEVIVHPDFQDRFRKERYASFDELVEEKLQDYLKAQSSAQDKVVLALDQRHNQVVANALSDQKLILSLFEGRANEHHPELVSRATAIFSDESLKQDKDVRDLISREKGEEAAFRDLPYLFVYPFHSEMENFGASSQEQYLYVNLFIDNISIEQVDQAMAYICDYIKEDERVKLLLTTFQNALMSQSTWNELINKYTNDIKGTEEISSTTRFEVELQAAKSSEPPITLVPISRQAELLRTIAKTRLFIDLGTPLNRHLRTECISAGVPQVNFYDNTFCIHKKNGYTLQRIGNLPDAMSFFLKGLKNWNASLIEYAKVKESYSDKEVRKRWHKVEEEINASAANRAK